MAKAKSSAPKKMTESAWLDAIVGRVGKPTTKEGVKAIVEALEAIGHREVKNNGVFVFHGFANFVVGRKPARPARKGLNPFTKEPTVFAVKPASKNVRVRPAEAIKDAMVECALRRVA